MNKINFLEKDMHPFLVAFAKRQFEAYSKTIDQSKSKTGKAGESEWVHPDIVSFRLTRNEFTSKIQPFYRQMNQDVAYLYSFELKRSVKLSTLKPYYFQAVSNSSWANEGYLVTVELDEANQILVEELGRLVSAFGIGVIKLDLEHPEQSRILFEAKKKEQLDFYTINKLASQDNADFMEFIEVVQACLEAKDFTNEEAIIKWRMDEIQSEQVLGEMFGHLSTQKKGNTTISDELILEESQSLSENEFRKVDKESFFRTKLEAIWIKGEVIQVQNWRQGFAELAKYCQSTYPELFDSWCFLIPNSNQRVFLRNSTNVWLRGEMEKFSPIDETTWFYNNLNIGNICGAMLKVMDIFGLSEEEVLLKVKQ